MYQFRDPIHGFIEVTELEKKLIDSSPFQRLRNIKQLATTYLVYHGAEHTRFGHSLGVMHLVTRAFETIIQKKPKLFNQKERAWYRQILRLIALIHDLGHAPFSHASEELFADKRKHEDYTRDILLNTEVSIHIKAIGKDFVQRHGSEYDITPELLWLIYDGGNVFDERYVMPDFVFLKSFMDGALDCDKMDYLMRDSYYCGVKYGNYDMDRLVSSFTVYVKPKENVMLLAVERGGIHALEEFILARYFMFIQVYYHKTRRMLDKRLISCLGEILPDGKYPVDISEYLKWDDVQVINAARQIASKKYASNFLTRNVMSCIYQTDIHSDAANAELLKDIQKKTKLFKDIRKSLVDEILEDKVKIEDLAQHIYEDEPIVSVHNIADGLDDKQAIPIIIEHQKEPRSIYQESMLIKGLQKSISIKRIYVSNTYKNAAEAVIEKCLKK